MDGCGWRRDVDDDDGDVVVPRGREEATVAGGVITSSVLILLAEADVVVLGWRRERRYVDDADDDGDGVPPFLVDLGVWLMVGSGRRECAAVVVIWFCEKRVWIFLEIRTAYPITFFLQKRRKLKIRKTL